MDSHEPIPTRREVAGGLLLVAVVLSLISYVLWEIARTAVP
ncbi:MAG TPA: hypothetical protein VMK65_07565 [Longimicrobiales bacterium]|nr:hypothetical protein [Longimicrobiales bacterium]